MATAAAEARQALIDLTTLTTRELRDLWRSLAGLPPGELRDALMVALPALGEEYGFAAGALATDWYDDLRAAAGVRGRFAAEPAEPVGPARWESLVRWGLGPLFREQPDTAASLTLIEGGLQRTVADQHRLTVVENTQRDPQAKGWRRIGVGDTCTWCRGFIDRGAVYTGSSVTFRSHDNCNCAASPSWDDVVVKVSPAAYEASRRYRTEAEKRKAQAAYKAWLREQYGEDAL